MFDALSLATNQLSAEFRLHEFDEAYAEIEWIGAAPVGAITVEVASDLVSGASGFVALDFGSTIDITGSPGKHTIRFDKIPFSVLRVRYTRTSGTGTMNIYLSGKTTGGVQ